MSATLPPKPRVAVTALAVTLAIQVFVAFAGVATAVLAPAIAPGIGVAPQFVGLFVGLMYVGGMAGNLASGGFVERYGAIRVSQACVLLCAAGIGLVAGAPGVPASVALVGVAALVLGHLR